MKKILKNKSLILLFLCIFALVGCGKNRDKKDGTTEAKETTEDTTDDTTTGYTEYDDNDPIILRIGMQPGGDMTLEEFEAASVMYEIYSSGKATYNKSDKAVQMSDEDFEKIVTFCNDVISGDVEIEEYNGEDLPSYDVTVYDIDGKMHGLNSYSDGWIVGSDEIINIITGYFEEDDPVDDANKENDPVEDADKDSYTKEEYKSLYEVYGASRGISNIDELSEDYSVDDAINDGCFVIGAAKVYNDNLYEEFMKKYEDKEEAYIRVVQSTTEGDAIIYDIFYIPESKEWMDAVYPDRVDVVIDSTRDKFATEDERMIFMEKFDGIAEYESNSSIYWVAYRGDPEDIDLAGKDTFVLAIIN